jgi:hypothetical protein
MQATARLLRAVLHSNDPRVQALVHLACPTFPDVQAVYDLTEQLEAGVLPVQRETAA